MRSPAEGVARTEPGRGGRRGYPRGLGEDIHREAGIPSSPTLTAFGRHAGTSSSDTIFLPHMDLVKDRFRAGNDDPALGTPGSGGRRREGSVSPRRSHRSEGQHPHAGFPDRHTVLASERNAPPEEGVNLRAVGVPRPPGGARQLPPEGGHRGVAPPGPGGPGRAVPRGPSRGLPTPERTLRSRRTFVACRSSENGPGKPAIRSNRWLQPQQAPDRTFDCPLEDGWLSRAGTTPPSPCPRGNTPG